MIRSSLADLARHVRDLSGRGVVTVALDGFSGSGKSTLAGRLAREVGPAAFVAGDDFYRVMDAGRRRELSPQDGMARYFDWERLRAEALVPLRSGVPARYRPYDWQSGGGLEQRMVEVQPAAVVIVDGVYSARPELSDLVDLAVLVDTSCTVRQQRLAQRGRSDDGWDARWDAAERVYFSTVRPPESFDVVIGDAEPG